MENRVPKLTIVIPVRVGGSAGITLDSLKLQTFQDFKVVIINDTERRGASFARNEGFKKVDTELVIFADDDINFKHNALEKMIKVLDRFPKASYCYGRYEMGGNVWGHQPWWPELLKHHNYISTMSMIRTKDFPGFDESLKRLQDWDLWLTMLDQGKRGIYCDELIFTTKIKPGITFDENLNTDLSYTEAERIVKKKHNINEFNSNIAAR